MEQFAQGHGMIKLLKKIGVDADDNGDTDSSSKNEEKNNNLRYREVGFQIKDLFKQNKKRKYEYRWIVETVFSSIKRACGVNISAIKSQNTIKEMISKRILV